MAEEFIGPVIVEGRAGEVYATGVGIIAGYDGDIGNGDGVSQREERKQNGEGK